MACPSADRAALPVPDWVAAHWAGVKASDGSTRPDDPIRPGHVPYQAWRDWLATAESSARLSSKLGVAARAAARERSALARTYWELDRDGMESIEAEADALKIREVYARDVFERKEWQ